MARGACERYCAFSVWLFGPLSCITCSATPSTSAARRDMACVTFELPRAIHVFRDVRAPTRRPAANDRLMRAAPAVSERVAYTHAAAV